MLRANTWARVLLCFFACLPCACFAGYDSRWGQQKQAQQHLAAARTPTALEGTTAGTRLDRRMSAAKTMRVRLETTATHTAQVVDFERSFAATLTTANGVLEPALGIHLEVAESRAFKPEHGEDHLAQVLEDLRQVDDGESIDWVIALTGSVPRFENSFHELGMAQVVGKYVVLRALNDAAEYEAIRSGFSELSESERDALFHARLRHKVASVLLHEVGHTLGALHEREDSNLMNPQYSKNVQRFGSETLDVMRAVLAHRTAAGGLDDAGKQTLVALWKREPAPWVPAERSAEIARFDVHASPASSGAHAGLPANGPAPSASELHAAGLSPADEAAFEQANQLLAAGDVAGALRVGKPLFDAHPNVGAVAELRCNIAMRRGLSWEATRNECAGVMKGAFGGH